MPPPHSGIPLHPPPLSLTLQVAKPISFRSCAATLSRWDRTKVLSFAAKIQEYDGLYLEYIDHKVSAPTYLITDVLVDDQQELSEVKTNLSFPIKAVMLNHGDYEFPVEMADAVALDRVHRYLRDGAGVYGATVHPAKEQEDN